MATLSEVIARVESGNNQYAVRFEPEVFERFSRDSAKFVSILGWIQRVHSCSQSTAMAIAATSWGKYQLMGENLWPHIEDSFWTYGAAPLLQDQTFGDFLIRRGINYSLEEIMTDAVKRYHFISEYNGPGNIDAYWASIQKAAAAAA